jgi:predicted HTH transcriptional regulator
VVPKIEKMHIQTHTWELTYDDRIYFQIHEQHKREARVMKARSEGQLPLNDNEMKIIDAMDGRGPMSVKQIAVVTGISRSTVDQRLKALQRPNKGEWVMPLDGEKGKLYMADEDKERDWL